MSSDPKKIDAIAPNAVVVSNLTKVFRLHHRGTLKGLLRGAQRRERLEEFTALNNISFTVPQGETLAVIGKNGSGKSTLLGILARVYKPTSGTASLSRRDGSTPRIAPLLELGAGFHHELTGEENIHFYAALLGMSQKEVRARKESIIAFAELEGKIDTVLHGWNNGAKLRLGFSIAIHTDPDIMLVDEVLAVGDEAFQNRCFQKIAEMQELGKTILFVTHELPVVERVAQRTLWLDKGIIKMDGDSRTVLASYRAESHGQ